MEDKKLLIAIGGIIDKVIDVYHNLIKLDNGSEYYIFQDSDDAGDYVREYWEDMASNDKSEFVALIGEERLVNWAIGESDEFGISSFDTFLNTVESVPEEHFGYDGLEWDCRINKHLQDELGLENECVCYRTS